MADLDSLQSAQSVKIAGADSSGVETFFADVDSSGNQKAVVNNASGASAVNIQDGGNSITIDGNVNLDVTPSTQTITALDSGTSTLVGANGQTYYVGTPTTNSSVSFSLSSIETVSVQASLLGAGGTLVVEVSMDNGTFWLRPNVYQISTQNYTNAFTAPFTAIVNVAGINLIRVRSTSSWSGTATIRVIESMGSRSMIIGEALPTGANVIGAVTQSGAWNITNISGTISLPTGAATSANQTTEITALQILDDVPTVQNGALSKGTPIMGQLDDASTTAATEDNVAAVRITAQRGLHVNLRNVSGTEIGTTTNRISVTDADNGGGTQAALTVGTSAVLVNVSGSNLASRTKVTLFNNSSSTLYWGYTNAVTTSTGLLIFKNQMIEWLVGPSTNIYVIAGTAGNNTRVAERA